MASLISTTERAILTGIFMDIFDTFQRTIKVYKTPTRVSEVVDSSSFVYGFGESQAQDSFTYREVSQEFPAVVRYKTDQSYDQNSSANILISAGEVSIKVKRDCRDYINADKTEKIVFDSRTFTLLGDERKQTFLDSEFFIFELVATK